MQHFFLNFIRSTLLLSYQQDEKQLKNHSLFLIDINWKKNIRYFETKKNTLANITLLYKGILRQSMYASKPQNYIGDYRRRNYIDDHLARESPMIFLVKFLLNLIYQDCIISSETLDNQKLILFDII